jgi:hypothetical protein
VHQQVEAGARSTEWTWRFGQGLWQLGAPAAQERWHLRTIRSQWEGDQPLIASGKAENLAQVAEAFLVGFVEQAGLG